MKKYGVTVERWERFTTGVEVYAENEAQARREAVRIAKLLGDHRQRLDANAMWETTTETRGYRASEPEPL